MSKEKIKVYLYTRVSTAMQIDGYSLDAQKTKMKAFCDYNEYEIAGEYQEALKRIEELENENAELREELEYYKNRKLSGRQKHNAKWMAIYNDFVDCYENGMTMIEIAKRNNVSERTIYRYKAYYDKMRNTKENVIE